MNWFWYFVQKSSFSLWIDFGISSQNRPLADELISVFRPKVERQFAYELFLYFVQKLTINFGISSKSRPLAYELILVFRPKVDFWLVQKSTFAL